MSDIGEFGGSGGGGTPGTPLHSIQFNNPLGTFAGSADLTWVGGSGIVDLQHAAVGNFGAINNVLYAPGDPTFATPTAINVPLSVNEYLSGDLPTLGAYIDGQAIFTGYKHIGLGNAFVYGLDIENWINTDSTGPFGQFYGAWVATTNLGTGTVSEHVGVLSACTDLALTQIVSFHSDFLSQGVVHSTAGTVASYYAQKRIGNAMGVGGVATDFAAFVADLQFDPLAATTNYYGAKIGVPGGTPTISGTAYGVYIGDHHGLGSAPVSANLRSVGSNSLNIFEGKIDVGLVSGNTGKLDFIGTTSGKVTLSTQDAAGTWTLKLPTTAGTNTWFLQTDGIGNTTWAAGGGGGSPGLPLNSVQWNSAGSFAGATHFNIDGSGQPNVDVGFAYMHNGKPVLFSVPNVTNDNFFEGNAGNFTVTGRSNLGTGTGALQAVTTGGDNTAIGTGALRSLTTGTSNVALGTSAGKLLTGAQFNLLIGNAVMDSATGGDGNLGFGASVLNSNTTGGSNIAIGFQSMLNNTTGGANVAIGAATLLHNTVDGNNIAIGAQALQNSNVGGASNIAIGNQALVLNVTGYNNVAIGNSALFSLNGPRFNTAIGTNCLSSVTVGESSVGIGYGAGPNASSGSGNIFIGFSSGSSITTGANNLILGDSVDTGSNVSGCIVIGQNATNRLDYNLTNSGKWTAKAAIVLPVSAVASLPAGVAGAVAFVNDATQTMTAGVGAVVAGGGANRVPVYHDGTNWRIG
jgi:hypothetical protein